MLSRLRLRHFRNYTSLDAALTDGVTLLTGGNGQGKTSMLEAIHYLSLLRSFRTRKTSDLKQWGSSFFFAEGSFSDASFRTGPTRISISYANARRLRLNGAIVNKATDFIGRFRCIACVPEDIGIVKGGPSARRRFVDMLLCQRSNAYLANLNRFQTALKSRNRMLKSPERYGRNAIAAYDEMLVKYGTPVMRERTTFVNEFRLFIADTGKKLYGGDARVACRYLSNIMASNNEDIDEHNMEAAFRLRLESCLDRDMNRRATTVGPHLDEYAFTLDGVHVGEHGSEGQCRTMSLALKLASVDFLHSDKASAPLVMLVDDVLGELDRTRRRLFFENFEKATQVIVACTEASEELKMRAGCIYEVDHGDIKRG